VALPEPAVLGVPGVPLELPEPAAPGAPAAPVAPFDEPVAGRGASNGQAYGAPLLMAGLVRDAELPEEPEPEPITGAPGVAGVVAGTVPPPVVARGGETPVADPQTGGAQAMAGDATPVRSAPLMYIPSDTFRLAT
jgi:hypothetical protein